MITQAIINILTLPIFGLFSLIPPLDFLSIPLGVFNGANILFENVAYIFPVRQLLPIFVISFGLKSVHVVFSTILRCKSFIPGLGA